VPLISETDPVCQEKSPDTLPKPIPFSAILFSWHGCFMFLEVKLEKKLKANLLAPFSIFLPDLFTKKTERN
jgi:hypothetical protein